MVNIKFGTETVIYNVIEIEGEESLSVDSVYGELLRLTDKAEEKEQVYKREIERTPETKWLIETGAFIHNQDCTVSLGGNFKEIKAALKEKKQTAFWDDLNDEE